MFDPFSVSPSQVDEVSKHFTIQVFALVELLVRKGIITEQEWSDSVTSCTAKVDQLWQERKDAMRAEHPEIKLFEKFFGGMAQ